MINIGVCKISIVVLGAYLCGTQAFAQSDPYKITDYEKAACVADAEQLCADAYPDEHRLLSCMQANRTSLSSGCRLAFDAGLKSRHLKRDDPSTASR